MNGQAGKGGAPRQGQYSKDTEARYHAGYERAFGVECSVCNGKGYHWDDDNGKAIKTTCLVCNGKGHVKP